MFLIDKFLIRKRRIFEGILMKDAMHAVIKAVVLERRCDNEC